MNVGDGPAGPFMHSALYLGHQHLATRAVLDAVPDVPLPLLGIFDPCHDDHIVSPGYLSSKLLDYLLIRVSLSKL